MLLSAVAAVVALYVTLALIQPTGEGWGRGWNLIAFWFYASPIAAISGAIAFWRGRKASGTFRQLCYLAGIASLAFPIVSAAVIKLKA
jgi:hypothetical protein